MGKLTPTGQDLANKVVSKALTAAAGAASVTDWADMAGEFNIEISGNGAGTLVVERSFDGGATAVPLTNLGAVVSFAGPASETIRSREPGVLHRIRCTVLSGGSFAARISQ